MNPNLTKKEMLGALAVTGFKVGIWLMEVMEPFSLDINLGL